MSGAAGERGGVVGESGGAVGEIGAVGGAVGGESGSVRETCPAGESGVGFDDSGADTVDASRRPITGEEDAEILAAIEAVLDRVPPGVEVHVAGMASFSTILSRTMMPEMAQATVLSVLVAGVFLTLLFRSVLGVVLPLLTVGLSVFATMSTMGALGIPIMAPTQIIPSFLLAVGIGGAVHLVAIFYQALRRGEAQGDAVAYALEHSGLPILMTSLTTAGGLLSFIPAALAPISHFGVVSPIGVLLALLFVLVLLPALLVVVPVRRVGRDGSVGNTASQRLLVAVGRARPQTPAACSAHGLRSSSPQGSASRESTSATT